MSVMIKTGALSLAGVVGRWPGPSSLSLVCLRSSEQERIISRSANIFKPFFICNFHLF